MKKEVYILGAGFSVEAGAPTQEKIIEKIFELHKEKPLCYIPGRIEKFKTFLTDTLNISPEDFNNVPLEDIFTPLDRCLIDNTSFRNLDISQVKEIKELINYIIGELLDRILKENNKDYIDHFAKFLVQSAAVRKDMMYKETDPVSVISTNWDIMLDASLYTLIFQDHFEKAVVDYCCHISSFLEDDALVKPGLEMLGMGGFNIKLLKLHGSLNWLLCPRCQRLYVSSELKISVTQAYTNSICRHCTENFGHHKSHILISNTIMPTFLKDFSNLQYKIIWQNAGIELSEAHKIVFIGYSLPYADFEMRQLLTRMVRNNAEIIVVNKGHKDDLQTKEMMIRYKTFFGNWRVSFHLDGASKYILNLPISKS